MLYYEKIIMTYKDWYKILFPNIEVHIYKSAVSGHIRAWLPLLTAGTLGWGHGHSGALPFSPSYWRASLSWELAWPDATFPSPDQWTSAWRQHCVSLRCISFQRHVLYFCCLLKNVQPPPTLCIIFNRGRATHVSGTALQLTFQWLFTGAQCAAVPTWQGSSWVWCSSVTDPHLSSVSSLWLCGILSIGHFLIYFTVLFLNISFASVIYCQLCSCEHPNLLLGCFLYM